MARMLAKRVINYSVVAELVWPVRAVLSEASVTILCREKKARVTLAYPPTIQLASGIRVPSSSWSVLSIKWNKPFKGKRNHFLAWARGSKGQASLLDEAERVQSELVDRLHRLSESERQLVHCIRHFGPRDWVSARISSGSSLVYQMIGSAMLHAMTSRIIDVRHVLTATTTIRFEERTLHRAADLSECGYPTESLLLAFSVLDAAVQRFLIDRMKSKGVSKASAEQLLRNTTTRRLPTYLDSVLHLTCGKSLRAADTKLFAEMERLNGLRNDAIHNGKAVSRAEARQACNTICSVLSFLNSLQQGVVPGAISLTYCGAP